MSLPHAILTALAERPATGAGLARRFDRVFGHFWQASHQQIYRELGRLEETGWIASEPVDQGPGRQRRYRALAAGRRELTRWLASELPARSLRDEVMVRLRAQAAVGGDAVQARLEARRDEEAAALAHYRTIEGRDFSGTALTREQRLQHLVLKAGMESARMRVALYEEALAILAMPDGRAAAPGAARVRPSR